METNQIKLKLREGLEELFNVNEKKKVKHKKHGHKSHNHKSHGEEGKSNDNSKEQGEGGKKDYSDVRRAFMKIGGPSMVDVMILIGTPDDKKGVNRSLFRKKVKQIKNPDTGSLYQFDDEELDKVRTALEIKN